MTPQTITADPVAAWATRTVRKPRLAAEQLAYFERQRELMATACADFDRMIAACDNTTTIAKWRDLNARRDIARRGLARYAGRVFALAAALKHAAACNRCGRPLSDKTQPGYATGVGPECFKKDTPK